MGWDWNDLKARLIQQAEAQRSIDLAAGLFAMSAIENSVYESPIEQLFAATWRMQQGLDRLIELPYLLVLQPQVPVVAQGSNYRIDFVVSTRDTVDEWAKLVPKVAIEVDGHEFHERTKEQVAYRNARDRDLLCEGWKVFHFSGSEVFRDPGGCVLEVTGYCWRTIMDAASGRG